MFFIWEKTETSEIERDWLLGAHRAKRLANGFELGVSHFADESERDVKILCAYPLRLRGDGAKIADQPCEIFSHGRWNLQRDGHFAADGAFGLNQFRRNIGPRGLQFVAVADYSAQKVR